MKRAVSYRRQESVVQLPDSRFEAEQESGRVTAIDYALCSHHSMMGPHIML